MAAVLVAETRSQAMGQAAGSRRLRIATPLGLFVLAVAVRALPWREVFAGERILPFGNDAWYHLRRIVYGVAHFPFALDFDSYLAFPHGAKAIWSPVFDWTIAALAVVFVDDPRRGGVAAIEQIAVWVPPVLGGATVVAAWALASRHFGAAAALVGGLVLCVLSGHFWYSQVGFVDHHAAVALVTTLLLWACMGLVAPEADAAGLRRSTAAGAASAAALAVWPGTLLHLAVLELGLAVHWLSRPDADAAARAARRLAVMHGVAALAIAPLALGRDWPQWSAMSPVVLSNFQPWWLGAIALGTGLCSGLLPRVGHTLLRRIGCVVAVAAAALGASLLLWPDLGEGFADAWQWLSKEEHFQQAVAESQPLFVLRGAFTASAASVRLSLFLYLLPIVLLVWAWALRGRSRAAPSLLFLFWTLALLVATLLQRRFFNTLSVALALCFGVAAVAAFRALPASLRARPVLARALVASGVLLLLAPSLGSYRRALVNEWGVRHGERLRVDPGYGAARIAYETAIWLRKGTPPTRGWLLPRDSPDYGVLAPWHLGHVIQYVGRRPTVVDNFGDDLGVDGYLFARAAYLAPERDVIDALRERRIRYVVAQRGAEFLGTRPSRDSLHHAMGFLDGSRAEPPPGAGGEPAVPALAHLRLVYESRPLERMEIPSSAAHKVFEVVPGVRVEGKATPGAAVVARLALRTARRSIDWTTLARAGEDGRYVLHLPYATRGARSGGVTVADAYRLRCGGREHRLEVSEASIQAGGALAGPACRERSAPDAAVGR